MTLLLFNLALLFFIVRFCLAGWQAIRARHWEDLARASFMLCVMGCAGFILEPLFSLY